MKMHESYKLKINPSIEVRKLREAQTVASAVDDFIQGYTGGTPSFDEVKEYLVSTMVVTDLPPDDVLEEFIANSLTRADDAEFDIEDEDTVENYDTDIGASNLKVGDILDMGEYGTNIIFLGDYDGERFWGTDNTIDFEDLGEDAPGWYFYYHDILDLIGQYGRSDAFEEDITSGSITNQPTGALTTPGMNTAMSSTQKADLMKTKVQTIQKINPNVDPNVLGKLDDPALDMVLNTAISKKTPGVSTPTIGNGY